MDAIRPLRRDVPSRNYQHSTEALELNISFYGITAVASLCLAVAGIVLHWHLTFVEQY